MLFFRSLFALSVLGLSLQANASDYKSLAICKPHFRVLTQGNELFVTTVQDSDETPEVFSLVLNDSGAYGDSTEGSYLLRIEDQMSGGRQQGAMVFNIRSGTEKVLDSVELSFDNEESRTFQCQGNTLMDTGLAGRLIENGRDR